MNGYRAAKGDMLDELLGAYINEHGCEVPIRRIGNGYYLFGTRKIYAKILNGKLVIRVGGGYMIIAEFIATYADVELQKIHDMDAGNRKKDEGYMAMMEASGKVEATISNHGARSPGRKSVVPSKKGGEIMVGQSSNLLSGTTHSTKISAKALERQKDMGLARTLK